jgi:hypothetical protein
VQSGEMFILETVPARRSSEASVRIAVDMVRAGILSVGLVSPQDMNMALMIYCCKEREGILRLDATNVSPLIIFSSVIIGFVADAYFHSSCSCQTR